MGHTATTIAFIAANKHAGVWPHTADEAVREQNRVVASVAYEEG